MCNTHDSFHKEIANRYGTVWQEKVRKFSRLRTKCKKLECDLEFVIKCRDNGLIPSFTRIKPVQCIRDYSDFFRVANEKLLRRVVSDFRRRLANTNKQLYGLHLELAQVLDANLWQVLDAMSYIRSSWEASKTVIRHEKKLTWLKHKQKPHISVAVDTLHVGNEALQGDTSNGVVNLSSHVLSVSATQVLSRGLNFAPAPRKIPIEDVITSVEDTLLRNKVPHRDSECIRQDIASMLRKMRPPKSNTHRDEMIALKELRNNEDLLVLPADKGNAVVVVDTVEYERRLHELISDSSTYKKVNYNPTARITAKVTKLLQSSDNVDLIESLRPHNPTAPKIYGLPKIHKPDWPLRPIISQIDAPTYKLSKFLASTLQPLTGKTNSFVRDSRHFVSLIDEVKIQPHEIMVSFDIKSLFTNVPVQDTMTIISNLIRTHHLPTEYIAWTEFCLKSGYFVWRGEFYLQVDGVAMGLPIAPVVANIFMEWLEDRALNKAPSRPRYWWRYVDDIFAVVDRSGLGQLTSYLNTVHSKIEFTVEEENDKCLPFLDVLVMRKPNGSLAHTVYRKPTHTDRYLKANSHHHPVQLASVPRTLINRAMSICDPQHVDDELKHVRRVLETNGYKWRQCSRWASNSESNKKPHTAERSPIYLPFVEGVTDKIAIYLKRRYDIKTYFRSAAQLRRMLRSPKDRDPLSGPGVYRIPCDCGLCYIGETRRNISARLTEHIRSVKNVDTVKSAVAEHAYISDSRHYLRFDKVSVLSRDKFFIPRKVREAIEISRHPNFNRDRGWSLAPAWRPVLSERYDVLCGREQDSTSTACRDDTMELLDNVQNSQSDSQTVCDTDNTSGIDTRCDGEKTTTSSARQLRFEKRSRQREFQAAP